MLPDQLSKRVVFLRRCDILSFKLCSIKLYQFLSKCICTTGADGSFGWTHFLLSMSCIACILVQTCIKLDQHLVTFGTVFGSETQVSKSGINLCDALCEKSWFVFFNTCFQCNLHCDLTHRTISTHGSLCFPKPVWLLEPPCTHWRPEGSCHLAAYSHSVQKYCWTSSGYNSDSTFLVWHTEVQFLWWTLRCIMTVVFWIK